MKVLLNRQAPSSGGYIGGIATLCDSYLNHKEQFQVNGYDICQFNYQLPQNGLFSCIGNSKLHNVLYGLGQIKALRRILSTTPEIIVHINTSRKALFFKDVLLAKFIRKKCKGRIVMTIHVGDIKTVFHNRYTQRFLIALMNKCIDKVIFLSEIMRQQFICAGLNERQTAVLYNFFDIKPISPVEKVESKVPNIIFLGSVNREKGIIELLQSLRVIEQDFHLDICGTIIEDTVKTEFERYVQELGDKVTYHGYVGKEKKEELLYNADILVLPSYREGLPISILEAMATSCAIITTPVGAVPEILTSENAIIVSPRNVEELRDAFLFFINNPGALKQMREANFAKAQSFTGIAHINKLCKLYK